MYVEMTDSKKLINTVEAMLMGLPEGKHMKVGRYIPKGDDKPVFWANDEGAFRSNGQLQMEWNVDSEQPLKKSKKSVK